MTPRSSDIDAGAPERKNPAGTKKKTPRKKPSQRKKKTLRQRFGLWKERGQSLLRILNATPPAVRTITLLVVALALFSAVNLVYHVLRKPTEMFFPVSDVLTKSPTETWQRYEPFFRAFATNNITPQLLAALAQVEGAGNPMAHTYWRWRLTWDLFAIYQPASSAVGMYQMTDPTFSDARHFCIRHHTVIADGAWDDWHSCWFNALYTRVVPSHAIELTAVSLDRSVRAILTHLPNLKPSIQQKQDLAAIIHLCGPSPAKTFAQQGFQLMPGERCGDHDPQAYLTQVNAMSRQFLKLSAPARK
jgi:hypothetical protein